VTSFPRRPLVIGLLAGTVYGIIARGLANDFSVDGLFVAMTWSFLFVVPFVMGYLTVRPHPAPSWVFQCLAPWVPTVIAVLVAALVGWEGSICIIMAFPVLLIGSTLGGLAGGRKSLRRPAGAAAAALLPVLLIPLEMRAPRDQSVRVVTTSIAIDAAAAKVWNEIASVRTIQPEEQRSAFFTWLGFPRPLSATLSRPGVGGIRMARFERGLLFLEAVTVWEPERRLRFTIAAQTDSIPATTLDRHVTIGGEYFDVLTGEYTIESAAEGSVLLRLKSELRVSTTFNFYASPWADIIMRSIQQNILEIIKTRAERP
jgi:hypothetical protein